MDSAQMPHTRLPLVVIPVGAINTSVAWAAASICSSGSCA